MGSKPPAPQLQGQDGKLDVGPHDYDVEVLGSMGGRFPEQRLHVLKIAYHAARRKEVMQEIAGSFQFLEHPAIKARPAAKISRVPGENRPKEPRGAADH